MWLKDKIVVISGVGARFGKATAHLFAQEGANVILLSRKEDIVKPLVDEIIKNGGKADYMVMDATYATQVEAALSLIATKYGKIDVLFNNAGGSYTKKEMLSEMDDEFWDATLRNNLKSAYLLSKHSIKHMKNSGGGSIINVSASLKTLLEGNAAYATAKSGIVGLTKNLAREVRQHNIRVNCIMPGVIRNEAGAQVDESALRILRKGNSEDVAHAALYFASDRSSWVTGQTLVVDGGEELHLGMDRYD